MKENSKYTRFNKTLWYWLPAIIWAIIIFSFSAHPTNSVSEVHWQDFVIKKTAHIVEYGIFTLLLFRAMKKENINKKKAFIYAFFIAAIYGSTDEYHQSFTPGREPTLRDVLFDTFGSGLSIYFINYILPKSPKQVKLLARRLDIY
jgi:hypothetical protein